MKAKETQDAERKSMSRNLTRQMAVVERHLESERNLNAQLVSMLLWICVGVVTELYVGSGRPRVCCAQASESGAERQDGRLWARAERVQNQI
jgi:hypothetical protein